MTENSLSGAALYRSSYVSQCPPFFVFLPDNSSQATREIAFNSHPPARTSVVYIPYHGDDREADRGKEKAANLSTSASESRYRAFAHSFPSECLITALTSTTAKKLKQTWVEVKKIKSKWKAQKRKEGLVTQVPTIRDNGGNADEEPAEDSEEEGEHMHDGSHSDAAVSEDGVEDDNGKAYGEDTDGSESLDEDMLVEEVKPAVPAESSHKAKTLPSRGRGTRGRGGDRGYRGRGSGDRGGRGGSRGRGGIPRPSNTEEKPSLRELNNIAYSRSSLHTHTSRGDRGRGSSQPRGRGRGQPDMRLRMNAMLEKIKRDVV